MPVAEHTIEFHVSGMTCTGCVNRVTNVLERLEGVRKARVTLEDEKASVDYDPTEVDGRAMKDAIRKAGYSAEEQ